MKSYEVEQQTIAALLAGGLKPAAREVISWLTPEMFNNNAFAGIFAAIRKQALNDALIDIVMLNVDYNQDLTTLAEIANKAVAVGNLCGYARKVRHYHLIRSAQKTMTELAAEIAKPTTSEAAAEKVTVKAIEQLKQLLATNEDVKPVHMPELLDKYIDVLEARQASAFDARLLKTGIDAVDEIIGGINPTDLTVIAGRPAMGKTEFALTITRNVAKANGNVLFFSLEMGNNQLMDRIISAETGVSVKKLRSVDLMEYEFGKITQEIHELKDQDIYLVDKGGLSANQITAIAERHIEETGEISAIVIDYLGLMDHGNVAAANKTTLIEASLNTLKTFAKNTNVPVILLSQLNRDVDARANKRPMSSDLRDSGAIEQDASQIIMLYRERAYDENSDNEYSEAIVTKNRFGETGTAYMLFDKGHFIDCDQAQAHQKATTAPKKQGFKGY